MLGLGRARPSSALMNHNVPPADPMPPPPAAADTSDDARAAKAFCQNGGLSRSGVSCQFNGAA